MDALRRARARAHPRIQQLGTHARAHTGACSRTNLPFQHEHMTVHVRERIQMSRLPSAHAPPTMTHFSPSMREEHAHARVGKQRTPSIHIALTVQRAAAQISAALCTRRLATFEHGSMNVEMQTLARYHTRAQAVSFL
eukprot:1898353-Pleurochrysis_carterae.AAC.4